MNDFKGLYPQRRGAPYVIGGKHLEDACLLYLYSLLSFYFFADMEARVR